jgi:hypothetical protein
MPSLVELIDRLEMLARLACPAGSCFDCLARVLDAMHKDVREAAQILMVAPGGFKVERGVCQVCSRHAEIFCMAASPT